MFSGERQAPLLYIRKRLRKQTYHTLPARYITHNTVVHITNEQHSYHGGGANIQTPSSTSWSPSLADGGY